jgi:cell division GTPase FtsZ
MRALLIGVGQAGGKLVNALSSFDANAGFDAVLDRLAVNTARADLEPLSFDTVLVGASRVNGQGVGGDNELGATVFDEDVDEVLSALDGKLTSRAEAVVVVAGLGGGTGSGGAPVLVRELSRVYDVPVYALGVLPGRDEGSMYHVNAARSLKTLVPQADASILVDNDAWRSSGESVEAGYESINQAVAQRIGLLLASGEAVDGVGESVVDASEVINTLRGGGVAAVGYASAEAAPDAAENISVVTSLTRRAVRSGMSLQDVSTAESALLVVAGRPAAIPRKGVERARRWLEEETDSMQVRGGDFPLDSDRLAVLVVLAGLERSDAVQRFVARAEQFARDAEQRDAPELFQNDRLDNLL